MSHCPICEVPLSRAGAYLASADYAGRWFTFPICAACRLRQERLPKQKRQRQDITAAHKVIKHPERYDVIVWNDSHEARLYARLSADAARPDWLVTTNDHIQKNGVRIARIKERNDNLNSIIVRSAISLDAKGG